MEDSGVGEIIAEAVDKDFGKGGRPSYNPYRLFAAILYAFSKHSFVWKPTMEVAGFLTKLSWKNKDMGLSEEIGSGHRQAPIARAYYALEEMLLKKHEYEGTEAICGPNRNSYFKTDKDAAVMFLKNASESIGNYVKPQIWQKMIRGEYVDLYRFDEEKNLILNGKKAVVPTTARTHSRGKENKFYHIENSRGCKFKPYCMRCVADKKRQDRRGKMKSRVIHIDMKKGLLQNGEVLQQPLF